jgi:hypothetical protein
MRPKPHPLFDDTADKPPAKDPPKAKKRQKERLQSAKDALIAFRFCAKSRYMPPTSFIASVIFPDRLLNALASNIDIHTLQDLEDTAGLPWVFGMRRVPCEGTAETGNGAADVGEGSSAATAHTTLFDKVLEVVQALDREVEEARNAVKRARLEKARVTAETKRAAAEERKREKRERDQKAQEVREAAARAKQELEEQRRAERAALGFLEFDSSSSPTPWSPPIDAPPMFDVQPQVRSGLMLGSEPILMIQ